jgi:hypothetical protein
MYMAYLYGLYFRCCGEYMDLRGMQQWEAVENCLMRAFITFTPHKIGRMMKRRRIRG